MPFAEAEQAVCLVARLLTAPIRAVSGAKANARAEANLRGFVQYTQTELERMQNTGAVDPELTMRLHLCVEEIQRRLEEPKGGWTDRLGNYRQIAADLADHHKQLEKLRAMTGVSASIGVAESVGAMRSDQLKSFGDLGKVVVLNSTVECVREYRNE